MSSSNLASLINFTETQKDQYLSLDDEGKSQFSKSLLMLKWRIDPISFVQDVIGFHLTKEEIAQKAKEFGTSPPNGGKLGVGDGYMLDPMQVDVLWQYGALTYTKFKMAQRGEDRLTEKEMDFADKIGISVMAGKGLGKTAIVAIIALHYLICYEKAGYG